MKIRQIIFPFSKNYSFLIDKWWHRLFIVGYVVLILLILIISFLGIWDSTKDKMYNISIKDNLENYSKNSDKNLSNIIPLFLNQKGSFGCLKNNSISYISTYSLESDAFCSADLFAHIDNASEKILGNGTLSKEQRKEALVNMLAKETEKRYCLIPKSLDCTSNKIIYYNQNKIFYLSVSIYSLLTTFLVSLFIQFLYFKGLIFIIYGKKSVKSK